MTTTQIVSLIALVGVALWSYGPKFPSKSRSQLDDIADIVRIRTTYPNATSACNELLKVLLEVGK